MDSFTLFAGGELGYFWGGEYQEDWRETGGYDESDSGTDNESIDRKDWKDEDGTMLDYGLLFGGRCTYSEQIPFVGSYYYGIPELAKDMKAMNRSLQITISYSL